MAPASLALGQHLQFLHTASWNLWHSAPSISAHLQKTQHAFANANNIVPRTIDGSTPCRACGTLLLLGWNCHSFLRSTKNSRITKRSRKERITNELDSKSVLWQCSRCGCEQSGPARESKAISQSRTAIKVQMKSQEKSPSMSLPIQEPAKIAVTLAPSVAKSKEEPAAKKRNRNKKSSLQALLATHKPASSAPSAGFGLDLMDFTKT